MGHYGALIKNQDKNLLKDFIIKNYMSEEEYKKLEDKLILNFPESYMTFNKAEKFLKSGDYDQFMLEVLDKYIITDEFMAKVLYIECHVNDLDELYVTGIYNKNTSPIFHYTMENYKENILFDKDSNEFYTKDKNNIKLRNTFNSLLEDNKTVYLWIKY